MPTTRRYLMLLLAAAVMVLTIAIPAVAGDAGSFVSKINSSRASAGLAPLETYWDLTDNAVAHANHMAETGVLEHSSGLGGVTDVWLALGENVGVGLDVSSIHAAFMESTGHKANILGDYNYVGVGVATDEDGFLWVTVIFMLAEPGLNGGSTTTTAPPATTTTTTAPPATTTTTTAPPVSTTTQPTKETPPGGSDEPEQNSEAVVSEDGAFYGVGGQSNILD